MYDMELRVVLFVCCIFLYFFVGGTIDYWQSARHHGKLMPSWLNDYFGILWLVLYTFLLPGMMVFLASYSVKFVLLFVGASAIGSVIWDMIYSVLDQKKAVSDQKDYFYFRNTDYGFTSKQIALWHAIRATVGLLLFATVFGYAV